jgi:asparagine synthase (glutamine-hydrolysing)
VCGLLGVTPAPPGLLGASLVGRLFALLDHRGPDDRGWLTFGHEGVRKGFDAVDLAGDVALLHTRLSILDLSEAGHQPMSTADGRYHLSFNGEIYNYVELRRELEGLGHTFSSGSDTEVLLAAYAAWGAAALERLVGMFALAILDTNRRVLVLARDHFGIKPLYYTQHAGRLAFASEIPPLLELPGVARRGNPQRVYEYLRWGEIDHGAETLFDGILQLRPGHYAELPLDGPIHLAEQRYWQLKPEPVDGLSLDEAAERLQELYLESVRIHLRSDVPVGVAFSGGVDSSANVTAMRRLSGEGLDLHTFSFVPEDPALSEAQWISLVAGETRAVTHTVTPTPQELEPDLDRLISVQGEPFGSTSIYAQYRVFQLAREGGVKVMLDGQGADELFAGYRYFLPDHLSGLLASGRLVTAGRLLAALSSLPGATPGHVLSRGVAGLAPSVAAGPVRRLAGRSLVPDWLDRDWLAARDVVLEDPWRRVRGNLREHRLLAVETTLRTLLRYEDRNSMAFSIESRVPFLTPALASFAVGMPDDYLIAPDGSGKLVLRRSLRGLVPEPILERRDKIGFATPEASWLKSLGPWVDQVFAGATWPAGPIRVEQARRRPRSDPALWRVLNFFRWVDRFGVETT